MCIWYIVPYIHVEQIYVHLVWKVGNRYNIQSQAEGAEEQNRSGGEGVYS